MKVRAGSVEPQVDAVVEGFTKGRRKRARIDVEHGSLVIVRVKAKREIYAAAAFAEVGCDEHVIASAFGHDLGAVINDLAARLRDAYEAYVNMKADVLSAAGKLAGGGVAVAILGDVIDRLASVASSLLEVAEKVAERLK